MNNENNLKELVREKYSAIAGQDRDQNLSSCCGATACCTDEVYNIMADDYTQLEGYNPDADLGLGCGIPTQFAKIKEGDTVLDLGSGAGNDAFVARKAAGASGKVIGVDFSETMLQKAQANAEKLQLNNVEFRQGDIEKLPVTSDAVDVVLSNCVLNLVPDKEAVFAEIYRVLKAGGHFSISDIVLIGELSPKIKQTAELYAGCVSGAIQKEAYLAIIQAAGFKNIAVLKEKEIRIPDNILEQYLSKEETEAFQKSAVGIFSVTVYAEKSVLRAGQRLLLIHRNFFKTPCHSCQSAGAGAVNKITHAEKLLFVCIENSNRSQMAQAFATMHGGENIQAFSAGSRPSGVVNPKAVAALKELKYDLSGHQSKSLDDVKGEAPFDVVVTMGCGDACPWMPAKRFVDWTIPDPKHLEPAAFNEVRNQIEEKVKVLLAELG